MNQFTQKKKTISFFSGLIKQIVNKFITLIIPVKTEKKLKKKVNENTADNNKNIAN